MSTWARIKRHKVSYLFIVLRFYSSLYSNSGLVTMVLSFTNFNMLQAPSFVGWSNIRLF